MASAASAADLHPYRTGTLLVDDGVRALLRSVAGSGSDREFDAFACAVISALSASDAAVSALKESFASIDARGLDALLALLVDFARCSTPASAIASALEDAGYKAGRAKRLAELLAAETEKIRSRLVRAGAQEALGAGGIRSRSASCWEGDGGTRERVYHILAAASERGLLFTLCGIKSQPTASTLNASGSAGDSLALP